jgi:hypothetical protein
MKNGVALRRDDVSDEGRLLIALLDLQRVGRDADRLVAGAGEAL